MTGLQAGVAMMAWVSLQPYFMWGQQKLYYAGASILILVCGIACYRDLLARRDRWVLAAAFALFLVYLSLLPKVDGGITRWFFLAPFTVVLLLLDEERLRLAFEAFHWIFALSLLPSMLAWLWIAAGLPVELRFIAPPGDIVQRGVTEYLELPGAVFLLSNGIVLPHGGVLFRLCGIYDEPGTVGTIAALCLAASRFRLRSVPGAITLAAGVMSFSIAFALLTSAGLLALAAMQRRPWLLAALPAVILAGAVPLSGLKFADTVPARITIVVPPDAASSALNAPQAPPAVLDFKPGTRVPFAPAPQWGLRNSPGFDSREQPRMRKLLDEYRAAPPGVLLFGIASDASVVHGWGSSVWYRILTDFGAVGFVWLFALFAYPLWRLWRQGRLDGPIVIFCALFLMSFYQRPIIWLPAQLLLYLAGLYIPKKSAKP
jgi:hypothetical protein